MMPSVLRVSNVPEVAIIIVPLGNGVRVTVETRDVHMVNPARRGRPVPMMMHVPVVLGAQQERIAQRRKAAP